jgi:hypothetical protein
LELLDSDGNAFMGQSPQGPVPVRFDGNFETGRPPGTPPGAPIPFAAAINIGPLPFEPRKRYEWRLRWNDEADDAWRLAFNGPPQPPPGGMQEVA